MANMTPGGSGDGPNLPKTEGAKNIPGALGVGVNGQNLNTAKAAMDAAKKGKIDAGSVASAAAGKYGRKADGTNNALGAGASIAASAAAGAAGGTKAGKLVGGGVQGAVVSGVADSLKKENRKAIWKPILIAVAFFMAPVVLVGSTLALAVLGAFTSGENKGSTTERGSAMAMQNSGIDPMDQDNLFGAGQKEGINWQLLAALYNYQKSFANTPQPCPVDTSSSGSGTETTTTTPSTPSTPPPSTAGFAHPIAGPFNGVGSRYGRRFHPVLHIWRMHWGQDFGAASGTPLVAAGSGTVVFNGSNQGAGNYIKIQLDAEPTTIKYMHLVRPSPLAVGTHVNVGDQVGEVGSTGYSTAPHLHFEVQPAGQDPQDPLPWMKSHGIDPSRAYDGSIGHATGFNACVMENPPDPEEKEFITEFALKREEVIKRILVKEMYVPDPATATDAQKTEAETRADKLDTDSQSTDPNTKANVTNFVASWISDLIKTGKLKVYTDMGTGMEVDAETKVKNISENSADAKLVREAYVTALTQLPAQGVFENTQVSDSIYTTALNWYLGKSAGGLSSNGMICAPPGGETLSVASSTNPRDIVNFDSKMLGYAATAVNVAKQHNVNENGQLIMLMTVFQESRWQMYASSVVPQSLSFPHDKVGSDHDSMGIYQQRGPQLGWAWGPMEDLMDVAKSTESFLGVNPKASAPGLLDKFPDQNYGDLGAAAQTVQVSDFPTLYTQWEQASRTLLGKVQGIVCTSAGSTAGGAALEIKPASGKVVSPIEPGRIGDVRMSSKYGSYPSGGDHWGVDLSTLPTWNIVSSCDGTVKKIDIDPNSPNENTYPTRGTTNYIWIDCGNNVLMGYAHFQANQLNSNLKVGTQVGAGTVLFPQGNQGYSTGDHLHFQISTIGSMEYSRAATVDPAAYLAQFGVQLPKPNY